MASDDEDGYWRLHNCGSKFIAEFEAGVENFIGTDDLERIQRGSRNLVDAEILKQYCSS